MKKLLVLTIFLLIFHISSAPESDLNQKEDLKERLLYGYHKVKYEKQLDIFIDHLGYKESRNDWTQINTIGCFGEWQFAHETLMELGYGHITVEDFKTDPSIFPRELQLKALKELIKVNELYLKSFDEYIGTTINEVYINKAGLLAGMHLGGIRSIQLFLTSNGCIDKEDKYGTKISDYIKEFSIYDLTSYNK
jgi:hypothetical protein